MEGPIKNEENFEGRVEIDGRKIMLDDKKVVQKGLAKRIGTIANGRGLYEWIK